MTGGIDALDGRDARGLDRDLERRAAEARHLAGALNLESDVRTARGVAATGDEMPALGGRHPGERERRDGDRAQ